MSAYAFIFARGGSKGLPGKNIKPLAGKPLLQYAIDTALAVPALSKVFVSTDDPDIARVARQGGAEVIERPPQLASDRAPEWLAWRHAVDWVTERYGPFDTFVSLPATSPLKAPQDVEAAMARLEADQADICISMTPADNSPYFNMVKRGQDGLVTLVNPPAQGISRRQDAPVVFDITTVVYVTRPDFIQGHDGLFAGKVTAVEVPKDRAVDIDDIYDFMLAEAILRSKNATGE